MSVLIKGLSMPHDCISCPLFTLRVGDASSFCWKDLRRLSPEDDFGEKRPDWCPLVELPEEHGPLVDLGEEVVARLHDKDTDEYIHLTMTFEELFEQAIEGQIPIVLEAEKCEEKPAYTGVIN